MYPYPQYLMFLMIFGGCVQQQGGEHASHPSSEATTKSARRVIFEKRLENGSDVRVYREDKVVTPTIPKDHVVKIPEFYAPVESSIYHVVLDTNSGQRELIDWRVVALLANPSFPEFLDVAISMDGSVAVVVWNDWGSTWSAIFIRERRSGTWKPLSGSPSSSPQGKNSFGAAATAASVRIDDKAQKTIVALTRSDGETVTFQSPITQRAAWSRVTP